MARASVRVRPAEYSDAADVADFFRGLEVASSSSARLTELLTDPTRLVLLAVDETTGALLGLLVARPDELGLTDLQPVLHVSHLVVAPRARRHGIGRSLLCAAVRAAEERGYDRMVVSVASAGSTAREANRYFAKIGFAPLVTQRVASTATLRRTLGVVDLPDRIAVLRRTRAQSARLRAGRLTGPRGTGWRTPRGA